MRLLLIMVIALSLAGQSCQRHEAGAQADLLQVHYGDLISRPSAALDGHYHFGETQGGLVVAALPLYQHPVKNGRVPLAVRIHNRHSTALRIYRQGWVFTLKSAQSPGSGLTRSVGFTELPGHDAYEILPADGVISFVAAARVDDSVTDPALGLRLYVNIPNPQGYDDLAPPPLYDEAGDLVSGTFTFTWEDQEALATSEATQLLLAALAGDGAASKDLLHHPGRQQALERALQHPDVSDVNLLRFLIRHPELKGDDIILCRLTYYGPFSVNHLFLNDLAWTAIESGTAAGRDGLIIAFARRAAEGTTDEPYAHATRDTFAASLAANGFHQQAAIEQRRAYEKSPESDKEDLAGRVVAFTAASHMPSGVPRPDPLAMTGFSGDATRAYLEATLNDPDPHLQSAARKILQASFAP